LEETKRNQGGCRGGEYDQGPGAPHAEMWPGTPTTLREREVGRPRTTFKDIVKRDLELIGVEQSVALNRGRWRKFIASLTPDRRDNVDFKR